jgi:hypothetical protein
MIVAILENETVENVYQAEESTPFQLLFPNKTIIEVNNKTGIPFIGYMYKNGRFQEGDR